MRLIKVQQRQWDRLLHIRPPKPMHSVPLNDLHCTMSCSGPLKRVKSGCTTCRHVNQISVSLSSSSCVLTKFQDPKSQMRRGEARV